MSKSVTESHIASKEQCWDLNPCGWTLEFSFNGRVDLQTNSYY